VIVLHLLHFTALRATMTVHTELGLTEADNSRRQTQGRPSYLICRSLPALILFVVILTALNVSYNIVSKPTELKSTSRASVKHTVTVQEALQWGSASWSAASASNSVPVQRPRLDGSEDIDPSVVLPRWNGKQIAQTGTEGLQLQARQMLSREFTFHLSVKLQRSHTSGVDMCALLCTVLQLQLSSRQCMAATASGTRDITFVVHIYRVCEAVNTISTMDKCDHA
jgi:hypothetical protein